MDTSARPRKKPHRAWLMLICMMLLQTGGLGIICNCFGTFIQPVCSDTGISYSDLSLYYSWECVAMLLFIPFANKILMKYKNVRLILFIAMTQSCISTGVMGLFDHAYLWWIAGISDGLAQSFITFLIIPYIINNWFHKYNGAIIGVCCAFACIGGAIFAPVCGSFIANYGWRISYPIAAALAWIICVPIPCIFLRDTPEQCGLKPYGAAETQGSEAPEAVSAAASEVDRSNFGVEYKTATRSACYVLLMVFGFCIACMCCFSTHLTSYAYTLGFPVESGSFATSLCMTGSVVGSFFIGRMSDRIGAPKAIAVGMAFGIAGILVDMLFTSYSPYFVFLGSFMFGVC